MSNQMILLFGGTGDLAKKKLLPALFTLSKKNKLIDAPIITIGRRALSKDQYKQEMGLNVLEEKDPSAFHTFFSNLYYISVDFKDTKPISFINLINSLDKKHQCKGNKMAYLATSYELFTSILKFLKNSTNLEGLSLAFEKPFGFNLESSQKLQKDIEKIVPEKRIYRVDHYLGKDMVDNLLTIRLKNPMFSDLWDSKSIDNIQIVASENFGVEGREEYYDKSGAIKDFVQNHLLQLASLVAMDPPKKLEAESIRLEKIKALKKLIVPSSKDIVLGQYQGYNEVLKDSKTETFVALKTGFNTKRWKNVPFYIKTGKYLQKKYSEINLVLKKSPNQDNNVISIRLGPEQEGIAISMTNKDEFEKTRRTTLEYCHRCEFGTNTPEAYERIFSEILNKNHSIFAHKDEITLSWKFTDALIKNSKKSSLSIYEKNISDIQTSTELLKKDKREWVSVERKITI